MMNRFPKVLLTLLLTLLLALSLSGCDLMVSTGPEAPIPPGVGQTGDQNTPDTPEEPGNTNTPETPDAPQEPGTDDSSTGSKDRYQTDPVPDGKPKPVEPETSQPDTSHQDTCTISISCATILDNLDLCDPEKVELPQRDDPVRQRAQAKRSELKRLQCEADRRRRALQQLYLDADVQLRLYRGDLQPVRVRRRRRLRLDVQGQRLVPQLRLLPVPGAARRRDLLGVYLRPGI